MPSHEEIKEKLVLCKSLFTNPLEVIEHLSKAKEIDFVQLMITTLVGVIIGLITSGGAGVWQLVSLPVSIFIGAVILLIFTLIAGGKGEYVKLVNLTAYLALITVLASLFVKVPVISIAVNALAAIYGVYVQYIALPYITGCKKEIMKIIVIIQMLFIGIALIMEVISLFGFFLLKLLGI